MTREEHVTKLQAIDVEYLAALRAFQICAKRLDLAHEEALAELKAPHGHVLDFRNDGAIKPAPESHKR